MSDKTYVITQEELDDIMEMGWAASEFGFKMVQDEYQGSGRWEERWECVVERDGRFFAVRYSVPATEMQESDPPSLSDVNEVWPWTEIVTKTYYKTEPK